MKTSFLLFCALSLKLTVNACIWDPDTLTQERQKSPSMASIILGEATNATDTVLYRGRIKELRDQPRTNEPAWWNDLAGAHLRLGEAKEAAALLETVTNRFPNDYGMHANLGTAYHLMGRYTAAEKEIRRDLEINPDAHFGLEKYHLALLQYLVRDPGYKARHVFVDEFSTDLLESEAPFFSDREASMLLFQKIGITNSPTPKKMAELDRKKKIAELEKTYRLYDNGDRSSVAVLQEVCELDGSPEYRRRWNLATDSKLEEGVLYMALLNPKEPACFVMLGVVAWKKTDLNLATAAFEKAVELGAAQSGMLQYKVKGLREYIKKSQGH